MKKCDQYLQVPYDIIRECAGKPFDAFLWAYIFGWENSTKRSAVHMKQEHIADFFGVSVDTVKRSIDRLQSLGLVGTKRVTHGQVYTTRVDRIKQFNKIGNLPRLGDGDCTVPKPEKAVSQPKRDTATVRDHDSAKCGITTPRDSAKCGIMKPQVAGNILLNLSFKHKNKEKKKNIYTKKRKEDMPESPAAAEPFEPLQSQGRSMPPVVNGRIMTAYGSSPGPETRQRSAMPPDYPGIVLASDEMRIAVKVFDTQAVKVGRYFTGDQRDAPEFVRKVMLKLALLRENGMTVTLGTLAKIVGELWDDGRYVEAYQAVKDVQAQADREIREAREHRFLNSSIDDAF